MTVCMLGTLAEISAVERRARCEHEEANGSVSKQGFLREAADDSPACERARLTRQEVAWLDSFIVTIQNVEVKLGDRVRASS